SRLFYFFEETKTIHDAVRTNNVRELEQMVQRGASVNQVDHNDDKFTPLHWAAYSNSLAALINNNINLNVRDRRNQTALHVACAHGNSFVLHTLLRGGADINHKDINGWSAAYTSAYHGRLGCLQLLVKWGGKLDDVDNEGNIAAHLAAMEGHLPCLKFIVSVNRDIMATLGARNDQGDTPKSLAQQFYKEDCVNYLDALEWEKDNAEQAENLAFPAHVAAYNGDLDHVKLLVEQGVVNINERDERGATMAHKAAGQGHLTVLQWLLEMGAATDIATNSGETCKDVARRFGQLACLKVLGGDKNESNVDELRRGDSSNTKEARRSPKAEEKGRAKTKVEELEKMLDIAKKNYRQLGGRSEEDHERETVEQNAQK
ncbi:unnamed protein product, partial [Didymodactylos carnosus]